MADTKNGKAAAKTEKTAARRPKAKSAKTAAAPAKRGRKKAAAVSASSRDKVLKPRGRGRKAVSLPGFDELQKKESELNTIKKQAKAKLAALHAEKMAEVRELEAQYSKLFGERLSQAPRGRGRPQLKEKSAGKAKAKAKTVGRPKTAGRPKSAGRPKTKTLARGLAAPITEREVSQFIEQKDSGIPVESIKLRGRKAKSVRRIAEAYEAAVDKSAKTILAALES